ncbi:restriction endonuclease subunit S, partial [Helicobacter sp. UBA3407]
MINHNLPKNWEVKTLAEVCTSKNSNIVLSSIENNTGKYPIYGAKGLLKTIDFYTIENESLGIVKDGAGVGRIFLLPEKSSLIGTMAYIQA